LLQDAGCFAIVLEKIPSKLAAQVSQKLDIPVIGIGAGKDVDGQVLVLHDMIGMTHEFSPRFLRRYLNLYEDIKGAVSQYVEDVKKVDFPNQKEQY
jgi:3-methyl-2-oxobutanoate hydroxymethyltransferase